MTSRTIPGFSTKLVEKSDGPRSAVRHDVVEAHGGGAVASALVVRLCRVRRERLEAEAEHVARQLHLTGGEVGFEALHPALGHPMRRRAARAGDPQLEH